MYTLKQESSVASIVTANCGGVATVTVVQADLQRSRLGGTAANILLFRAKVLILHFTELTQYVYVVLSLVYIKIGSSIWETPGVTIGNPFGRIALAASMGRAQVEYDQEWREGRNPDPKWRRLSELGLSRAQVLRYGSVFQMPSKILTTFFPAGNWKRRE